MTENRRETEKIYETDGLTFVFDAEVLSCDARKDGLFDVERQTDVILLACRLLGINAVKTGRNDLTVTGRKFSGHAYFSSHGFNYHHGTIIENMWTVPWEAQIQKISYSQCRTQW